MPFQTTVRATQTTGLVGEAARNSPTRAEVWTVDSSSLPLPNTIGAPCVLLTDGVAIVGGGAGGTDVFVGVISQPKEYALRGDAASPLTPNNTVPDNTEVTLTTMGIMYLEVVLAAPAPVGTVLTFDVATGVISDTAASATQIAFGATIYAEEISAGTRTAIVQLTN